eukprot:TRINITY_DN11792_c0_g1_i1.p1 TRINITY_DN11792_c0_g1~~TRINITY_DN11792_c0_g1_i1.p1  ORF type:complete len:373 (-),score=66.67 TRINITY_DN11792_c0_g1_i1:47-1165(-)
MPGTLLVEPVNTFFSAAIVRENAIAEKFKSKDPAFWSMVDQQLKGNWQFMPPKKEDDNKRLPISGYAGTSPVNTFLRTLPSRSQAPESNAAGLEDLLQVKAELQLKEAELQAANAARQQAEQQLLEDRLQTQKLVLQAKEGQMQAENAARRLAEEQLEKIDSVKRPSSQASSRPGRARPSSQASSRPESTLDKRTYQDGMKSTSLGRPSSRGGLMKLDSLQQPRGHAAWALDSNEYQNGRRTPSEFSRSSSQPGGAWNPLSCEDGVRTPTPLSHLKHTQLADSMNFSRPATPASEPSSRFVLSRPSSQQSLRKRTPSDAASGHSLHQMLQSPNMARSQKWLGARTPSGSTWSGSTRTSERSAFSQTPACSLR